MARAASPTLRLPPRPACLLVIETQTLAPTRPHRTQPAREPLTGGLARRRATICWLEVRLAVESSTRCEAGRGGAAGAARSSHAPAPPCALVGEKSRTLASATALYPQVYHNWATSEGVPAGSAGGYWIVKSVCFPRRFSPLRPPCQLPHQLILAPK